MTIENSIAVETGVGNEDENASEYWPGWMQSWVLIFICVSSCSALAVRQFGGII